MQVSTFILHIHRIAGDEFGVKSILLVIAFLSKKDTCRQLLQCFNNQFSDKLS